MKTVALTLPIVLSIALGIALSIAVCWPDADAATEIRTVAERALSVRTIAGRLRP